MNHMIYSLLFISILAMSGCFSSPTNTNGNSQNELKLLWEYAYNPDGGAPKVKSLIHGNKIITSGDKNVTSLDYKSGEQIWKTPFEHHRQLTNKSFGINNDILVGSIVNELLAWDILTGDLLWSVNYPDSLSFNNLSGITYSNGKFITYSDYYEIFKTDLSGKLHVFEVGYRTYESSILNNLLIAGQRRDNKGLISAYNFDTMELVWRFEPGEFGFPSRVAPIIENDIVYVGTTGGLSGSQNGFFALNAQSGQEIWRREGIFTYSAVLEGEFIYVNDAAGIFKLRKSDGGIEWYSDFEAGAGTGPIAYGYGYLYAPHSGTMHIVNAQNGEIVHRMSPPHGNWFWLVTADAGRIFAQSSSHLYAFAPWGHKQPLEE